MNAILVSNIAEYFALISSVANPSIMPKCGYVYILASRRNGTLYTGVTSDLVRRVWEHKNDEIDGFTKRYGVHRLVYYEAHEDVRDAIRREKRVKKWNRQWKLELIEKANPEWRDLYDELGENPGSLA